MLDKGVILIFAFGYMGLLFAIARYGDKRAQSGRSLISNPYIYTLSLAVYCTAWTFYGSVGMATRTGISYLFVYIGPTLTAALGWVLLRKILRISKDNRITSIADFIASRYGKSALLAGVVTVIAVLGVIPYISVQIKAISTTFLIISHYPQISNPAHLGDIPIYKDTALYVALLLALFAVLFGTRNLAITERHEGLVSAIAFESIVKLIAFTSVGLFVTYGLYDGVGDLFRKAGGLPAISRHFTIDLSSDTLSGWYTGLFLSMMAIICLPRQFQVAVVENVNETHLKKAIWLFPLYLLAINIFVLPVAFGGVLHFSGGGVDPDTFVLALPMAAKKEALVLLVFIGGLSAASGMVIVESIALATMICNDLVMPVLLRLPSLRLAQRSDITRLLLLIRRGSILSVLLLGYAYFHLVGEYYTLVSIGMISFSAVAQFAPAILGGIFWKGGTRKGALWGMLAGFALWCYTLVLPGIAKTGLMPDFLARGPFGIGLLKPYPLFDLNVAALGFDQYAHALFWSMLANVGTFLSVSLFSRQSTLEQTQATLFVDVFRYAAEMQISSFWSGTTSVDALRTLLGRFLGQERCDKILTEYGQKEKINWTQTSTAHPGLISHVEKQLAGVIGSASARVAVASVVKEEPLDIRDIMDVLDETRQVRIYSRELEKASSELKAANEQLKELDKMKDDFISTVTHELRTPLTSVRALAEILHMTPDLDPEQQKTFTGIIVKESERLSRLINDVLDFQKIHSGRIEWRVSLLNFKKVIQDSVEASLQLIQDKKIDLVMDLPKAVPLVRGDYDRLMQVMLNLISNAVKFCDDTRGRISIGMVIEDYHLKVHVRDNGIGISPEDQNIIFEEFRQVKHTAKGRPKGTGLGLPITKRIIEFHQGSIWVQSEPGHGATFFFKLPLDLVREPFIGISPG